MCVCVCAPLIFSDDNESVEADLQAARLMAKHFSLDLQECFFTVEEGFKALAPVIRHLETFDVPTVRAAVPLYLLSRFVNRHGGKAVLVGEGADELFAGYRRFQQFKLDGGPHARQALHNESWRAVEGLHQSELLRVDRACMAYGVEARVPFLDPSVVQVAMNIDPGQSCMQMRRQEDRRCHSGFPPPPPPKSMHVFTQRGRVTTVGFRPLSVPSGLSLCSCVCVLCAAWAHAGLKMHDADISGLSLRNGEQPGGATLEKKLLRYAFADIGLPPEILYRPKAQFADGIGGRWLAELTRRTEELQAKLLVASQPQRGPSVATAEETYYRYLFDGSAVGQNIAKSEVVEMRHAERRKLREELRCPHAPAGAAVQSSRPSCPAAASLAVSLSAARAGRFLASLDLICPQQPSIGFLPALIDAFMSRVPFQNLTILSRPKRPPTTEEIARHKPSPPPPPCSWNGCTSLCVFVVHNQTH